MNVLTILARIGLLPFVREKNEGSVTENLTWCMTHKTPL